MKPKFNRTNESVDWARWTWNPVVGCRHNCDYCYARDFARRFKKGDFEPKFYPERLEAPFNTPVPNTNNPWDRVVFVCSMADLFGVWVDSETIWSILSVVEKTPLWTYVFLTKNPNRLQNFTFPPNTWVGATVDREAKLDGALKYVSLVQRNDDLTRFISFEPLLEQIIFSTERESMLLSYFRWVIIGACSKTSKHPEVQPEWKWVEHLLMAAHRCGCGVYIKPNVKMRPRELPAGVE